MGTSPFSVFFTVQITGFNFLDTKLSLYFYNDESHVTCLQLALGLKQIRNVIVYKKSFSPPNLHQKVHKKKPPTQLGFDKGTVPNPIRHQKLAIRGVI